MEVMMVLLEEEQAERKSLWKPRSQSQNLSFSDSSLQLNTRLPFLHGTMLQHFPHYCRRKWPEMVFINKYSPVRSQRQPVALLPGAEVHHDVSPQPHSEAQRRASGQLHSYLHLEHLGAVQAAESPHLWVWGKAENIFDMNLIVFICYTYPSSTCWWCGHLRCSAAASAPERPRWSWQGPRLAPCCCGTWGSRPASTTA